MGSPNSRLRSLSPREAVRLNNATCPYCGAPRPEGEVADEHVVGRRFVPKGKFHQSWNLILWACTPCNRGKADLEDDISAITMQPSAFGDHARDDAVLAAESARKGRGSKSRVTGKAVAQSRSKTDISFDMMPGVSVSMTLVGPPALDERRVFELARLQLAGFFFWITYNVDRRSGGYWPGVFAPAVASLRGDWGSVTFRAFMQKVAGWHTRVLGAAADEYFKVAVRKHPEATCWSWALEWNHNLRAIGFFGEEEPIAALARDFPPVKRLPGIRSQDGAIYRLREETALPPDEDLLFSDGPEEMPPLHGEDDAAPE